MIKRNAGTDLPSTLAAPLHLFAGGRPVSPEIEAAQAIVDHTPFPPLVAEELRRRARIRSTHYSTRIEGNRLTLAEAEEVVSGSRTRFHGRERDVSEVRNYWQALLRVEEWAARGTPLTEELIQRLHALVERGLSSPA